MKLLDERPEEHVPLIKRLGPGLITGAADDDPSGIATYSQVGAQFGYELAWTMLFSFPLMAVIFIGTIGASWTICWRDARMIESTPRS